MRTGIPVEFGDVVTDLGAGIEKVGQCLVEVHEVADEFAQVSNETAVSAEGIESPN